ncbi:3285_t:CDS:2 [Acaulospora morrowiae]|uniref:3285_t:CDS:1 n=1 Tax=Acaulospora morrowiae TaxID=94023 RepID=A0A9N9AKY6_9GLOM|nr:3285_t:CDS:2 [Acaulospora morrowiae]
MKYPSLEVAFPPVNFNKQEIYDLDFNSAGDQVKFYPSLLQKTFMHNHYLLNRGKPYFQIAVSSTKVLQILSTKDGKCIYSLERPISQKTTECQFRACRFGKGMSDGFIFSVVNSSNKTKAFIVKLSANTWERNVTKVVSRKPITTFAISEDGNLLAFGASDNSLGICDTRTLRVLLTIPNIHSFPITSLGFNHDSTIVVSGSVDNTVHITQLPEKFSAGIIGKYKLLAIVLSTLTVILAFFYQMYLLGEQ